MSLTPARQCVEIAVLTEYGTLEPHHVTYEVAKAWSQVPSAERPLGVPIHDIVSGDGGPDERPVAGGVSRARRRCAEPRRDRCVEQPDLAPSPPARRRAVMAVSLAVVAVLLGGVFVAVGLSGVTKPHRQVRCRTTSPSSPFPTTSGYRALGLPAPLTMGR